MKILFANIGWMTHYRGKNAKDQIVGGGSYRNDDKIIIESSIKKYLNEK